MALKTCINIDGKEIAEHGSPYFVAEISGNHQQCIEQARALIKSAKESGADAVKLQTYTADTLTLPVREEPFKAKGPWEDSYLYDLYQSSYTPWEWHEDLVDYAKKIGITLFSTPFDESSVDFLEKVMDPPIYKIASFEINHIPLLKKVGATKKPVVLSTGLASYDEIAEAIQALKDSGCPNIILLKCISAYPADPNDFNLRSIECLKTFGCLVGLSDHSLSSSIVMGAIGMGACMIEKHFVLSRKSAAVDGSFSLEPQEFRQMVDEAKTLYRGLGSPIIRTSKQEELQKRFRRSIYVSKPIKKGEKFTAQNIKIIRPCYGLHPRYWEDILGCKAKKDLAFGHPLSLDDVVF